MKGKEKDKKGKREDKEDDLRMMQKMRRRPVDFCMVLINSAGREYRVRLGDYLRLQPPIRPQVFKSGLFHEDPESEVILQYVAIPLDAFLNAEQKHLRVQDIRRIRFEFDAERKGSVLIDQLGFAR